MAEDVVVDVIQQTVEADIVQQEVTAEIPSSTILNSLPVEFRSNGTFIQRRFVGTTTWVNLVALDDIKGEKGDDGEPGREVEMQSSGGYIQWRYVGDASWTNLIDIASFATLIGLGLPIPGVGSNQNIITDTAGLLSQIPFNIHVPAPVIQIMPSGDPNLVKFLVQVPDWFTPYMQKYEGEFYLFRQTAKRSKNKGSTVKGNKTSRSYTTNHGIRHMPKWDGSNVTSLKLDVWGNMLKGKPTTITIPQTTEFLADSTKKFSQTTITINPWEFIGNANNNKRGVGSFPVDIADWNKIDNGSSFPVTITRNSVTKSDGGGKTLHGNYTQIWYLATVIRNPLDPSSYEPLISDFSPPIYIKPQQNDALMVRRYANIYKNKWGKR